jgi:hypothetical protein
MRKFFWPICFFMFALGAVLYSVFPEKHYPMVSCPLPEKTGLRPIEVSMPGDGFFIPSSYRISIRPKTAAVEYKCRPSTWKPGEWDICTYEDECIETCYLAMSNETGCLYGFAR